MPNINKKLDASRPHLSKVSPLAYRLVQGFILVNIAIAIYLTNVAERTTSELPLIGNAISFGVWAVVFLSLSAFLSYGLWRNNWAIVRGAMIAGLGVKTFWAFSLLYLSLNGITVVDVVSLWLFMAWTQAWTLVHLTPTHTPAGEAKRSGL